MKDGLTQEDRCELNNIRHEIEHMPGLTDREKLKAIVDILRSVLELYTAESILGSARYRLNLCCEANVGRKL